MSEPATPDALPVLSYAGPQRAPWEPSFWVNGPYLVMRTDADLPHRCIKCDCQATVSVRRRLYWAATEHEPSGGALRWIPFVKAFFAFQDMAHVTLSGVSGAYLRSIAPTSSAAMPRGERGSVREGAARPHRGKEGEAVAIGRVGTRSSACET